MAHNSYVVYSQRREIRGKAKNVYKKQHSQEPWKFMSTENYRILSLFMYLFSFRTSTSHFLLLPTTSLFFNRCVLKVSFEAVILCVKFILVSLQYVRKYSLYFLCGWYYSSQIAGILVYNPEANLDLNTGLEALSSGGNMTSMIWKKLLSLYVDGICG